MTQTIIEALDDPDLFGGMFDASSWDPWRVFLKALQALPMDDAELAVYRHHTGRDARPSKAARYAELVVGRRGGKSRILATVATYLGCVLDHRPFIVPGETPVIAIIAKDRDQAKVIKNYIVGFMREIPAFADMIEDELAESVRLTNRVVVEVHTASIAAPRGRTFLAVLCDETAFWPGGDAANPDVEVINAVRPGLSTIPYSLLLVASSPYAKRGILYANYAKYFGKNDAPVLVWQGTTPEMNSTQIDDPVAADMYETDPERASAEYGAQFRSDIVAFITREAVEAVLAHGIRELPPGGGITYLGHVDPSGGSADSMTLAIAHMAPDGTAVLDVIRERRPPFSPDDVVAEFSETLKQYRISRIVGDGYAGLWPRERFEKHGIHYEVSKVFASGIYSAFLPALNGRRVRLLDSARLIGQLINLERKTSRGGRDLITHAPESHDDVANSVAGVLVRCLEDRVPALSKSTDVLVDGVGVAIPSHVNVVYAVLATNEAGWTSVAYAALTHWGPKLLILDYDDGPMTGTLFGDIRSRVLELAERCQARGVWAWVSEPLVPHAAAGGLETKPIPQVMELPDGVLLSAARHVHSGEVKLTALAMEKADSTALRAAFDLRPGSAEPEPLCLALWQAVAIGLDVHP